MSLLKAREDRIQLRDEVLIEFTSGCCPTTGLGKACVAWLRHCLHDSWLHIFSSASFHLLKGASNTT